MPQYTPCRSTILAAFHSQPQCRIGNTLCYHSHPPCQNSVPQEPFFTRHLPPGTPSSRVSQRSLLVGILSHRRPAISSSSRPPLARLEAGLPATYVPESRRHQSPGQIPCPSHPEGRRHWGIQQQSNPNMAPKSMRQSRQHAIIETRNNASLHRSSVLQRLHQMCRSGSPSSDEHSDLRALIRPCAYHGSSLLRTSPGPRFDAFRRPHMN